MSQQSQDIVVRSYKGPDVLRYISELAQLRVEVFLEYPFLYQGKIEWEEKYLAKYAKMEDSVIVVAYDKDEVIGVSTGYPLQDEVASVQECMEAGGHKVADFFCLGESVLRKSYRGRGIGKRFMQERLRHAKALNRFKGICFYTSVRADDDPRRPEDYRPLDTFWKGFGFTKHPELTFHIDYPEIGEKRPSPKEMVFWLQKI